MVLKIADAHTPMRTHGGEQESPWITTELRELITGRNRLKRQAILTKHPSIWDKYKKKERNRIRNEIKMAKANYYKSEVEQNVGDPKEIWRTINELTYRQCTSNSSK